MPWLPSPRNVAAIAAPPQPQHAVRAWTVTGIVLGLDAILVGYWNARRTGKRRNRQAVRVSA